MNERLSRKEQIRQGINIPYSIPPTCARLVYAAAEGLFLSVLALGMSDVVSDPKSALVEIFAGTVGYIWINTGGGVE